jgi:hypothetical protein
MKLKKRSHFLIGLATALLSLGVLSSCETEEERMQARSLN